MTILRKNWLEPPQSPTRTTFARLSRTTGSLMRELMNLEIEAMSLEGRILDVGGGLNASYNHLLRCEGEVLSVNIDSEISPSVVADFADPLPFDSNSFDTVISFNTLEHLADDQFALNEMVRVLKPGGQVKLLVPFLYRVHGHPNDFHRHTASGWNVMLQRAGVPSGHQRIRPLVWDPFSTGWAVADVAPLGRNWWRARRLLRSIVLRRPLLMSPIDRREQGDAADVIGDYALGFVISAQRPEASDT